MRYSFLKKKFNKEYTEYRMLRYLHATLPACMYNTIQMGTVALVKQLLQVRANAHRSVPK